MFHAKRSKLLGEDLDLALRVEGQEQYIEYQDHVSVMDGYWVG